MTSHYWSAGDADLGTTRQVTATIFGHDLTFTTAPGVFSGSRLDPGTAVLLRTLDPPARGRVLDLGCGFGPIAVGLAVASPGVEVDAVDINERALALTRLNAEAHQVGDHVHVSRPDQLPGTARYDEIWSNPPIRVGKEALHTLLLDHLPRLVPGGLANLVVGKHLGSDSLAAWLTAQGWPTRKLASAKGFRVLRVEAPGAAGGPH